MVTSARVRDDYLAALPLPIPLPPDFPADQKADIAAAFLQYPLDPQTPVSFTRPLYPYPTYARYKGSGDVRLESSFGPAKPP